jgi:tetratricopeptide (TPR) repeat protein
MKSFAYGTSRLRSILSLSLVALAIVAASWISAAATRPSPASDLSDDYLAGAVERAGASTDRLIEQLQARLKSAPNSWQAYSQLGVAYLQKARETGDPAYYPKVESVLQKALALQPGDYVATAALGALELARHQFRSALEWGERARQINPQRAYAYGVVVDAQVELGRYDEAVETLQAMVDLRPDLSSYSRVSYLRELHGDLDGAIDAMQWAVEAGGPSAENTHWTRVQLGHLLFQTGQLDRAETHYRQALAADPGYAHALAGLARVHVARGEYEAAITMYSDVVNRMPLPEYVIALGDVYEAAGRKAEAQQQFDLLRAIERLYRANGVDTDLEMALFEADHAGADRLDEALARARRAFEQRRTIYAADVLAWTLHQSGQRDAAYAMSRQALRLGTQDALVLFHAGMIAYRAGHAGEAQAHLERALAVNPNFSLRYSDAARSALAALRQSAMIDNH